MIVVVGSLDMMGGRREFEGCGSLEADAMTMDNAVVLIAGDAGFDPRKFDLRRVWANDDDLDEAIELANAQRQRLIRGYAWWRMMRACADEELRWVRVTDATAIAHQGMPDSKFGSPRLMLDNGHTRLTFDSEMSGPVIEP
jgi:hypothetical protein